MSSFMQKQVQHGKWVVVNGSGGYEEVIQADLVPNAETRDFTPLDEGERMPDWVYAMAQYLQYIEPNTMTTVEVKEGWGARLSAPGYLDCTEWTVHDTREAAETYLRDTYDE